MQFALRERLRVAFEPPRYLAPPAVGIDVSMSGIKSARLTQTPHGIILASYADTRMTPGAFVEGEITDHHTVALAVAAAAKQVTASAANVSLSESKSYLFETITRGNTKNEWRTAVEQHLDELVPLPPSDTVFDLAAIGLAATGEPKVAGIGFARRIVEEMLAVFEEANVAVRSLEGETFAMARALVPRGDDSTVLIIDLGKTTTKIAIVAAGIPRFATTIGIGGHALTLAVQKHFGVTEEEARRVKAERGIVASVGNEDYLAAMLSTVSAIKDEIVRRFEYWQGKAALESNHAPITRVILVGGNASVRGLPEYLEGALRVPVGTGDVFTNLASRDDWLPPLPYTESLAYATAIGLALRDYAY